MEMLLDHLWIEGIDVRRLGCSSRDGYLISQGFELWQYAASKEDFCPVTRKGMGNRTAMPSAVSQDSKRGVFRSAPDHAWIRKMCSWSCDAPSITGREMLKGWVALHSLLAPRAVPGLATSQAYRELG
jgi:hypothetical protein